MGASLCDRPPQRQSGGEDARHAAAHAAARRWSAGTSTETGWNEAEKSQPRWFRNGEESPTPIPLWEWEVVDGSDLTLSGWPVFKNGFENGSLVGWSAAASD